MVQTKRRMWLRLQECMEGASETCQGSSPEVISVGDGGAEVKSWSPVCSVDRAETSDAVRALT